MSATEMTLIFRMEMINGDYAASKAMQDPDTAMIVIFYIN